MLRSCDAYVTARDVVADLAARRVSAVEIARASIARIEAYDDLLNAVVVRDFERGLAAARAADRALARGEHKPLLGVPITVKESLNVAGLATTWGMPRFADWIAREDAVVVERLRNAGAVLLGKTNVPFALGDFQSYNDIYGTTNNPWALERSPGGSSGGSAVAVAAGYVPLEIGSDIAGSLRIPAHFCGVCSHKPSREVIPSRDHSPPGTLAGTPDLAVLGPLARNVADLVAAFDVVAGPDVLEAAGMRVSLPPPRRRRLKDYRILVLAEGHPLLPADCDVRGAVSRLADHLRGLGVRVATECALLPNLVELGRSYLSLVMPVVFARQPTDRFEAIVEEVRALPPDADTPEAWALRGAVASHRDWLAADAVRVRAAYAFHELFCEFDAVLFPPAATPAFVQDQGDFRDRAIEIDGTLYAYDYQLFYGSIASALGLPATTIPLERTQQGLPVGVQIIGPYLEDRTTLHLARLIEETLGGFVPPPDF